MFPLLAEGVLYENPDRAVSCTYERNKVIVTDPARDVKHRGEDTPRVSPSELDHAWRLTRELSPRSSVRLMVSNETDGWVNEYSRSVPVDQETPRAPWAMNLFDASGAARYLCFDFDSKKGNASHDAGRLQLWLDELNIASLWCWSGPSRGVHLWVALDEPTDAGLVREIARMAAQVLVSLDPVPMTNARTGAVRPPLSPHRNGGRSEPRGDIDVMRRASTSAADVLRLKTLLLDVGAELPQPWGATMRGVRLDPTGEPYVAGVRRELSARMKALLEQPPAADASLSTARVLAACANARWRVDEVRELATWAPALEHLRSVRTSSASRSPRSAAGRRRALASAWRSAVAFVALNPVQAVSADEAFLSRAHRVATALDRVQSRADVSPGLWSGGRARTAAAATSYAARAVLDAVCLFMAQAARTEVEVDVRRISAETGYGRTRISEVLRWLTGELQWLEVVAPAEPPHGQLVRLAPQFSTERDDQEWTQVLARPALAEPLPLNYWTSVLASRLESARHDVFVAPRSLGRAAGRVYQMLGSESLHTFAEMEQLSLMPTAVLRRTVRRLHAAGLVEKEGSAWRRTAKSVRDSAAKETGPWRATSSNAELATTRREPSGTGGARNSSGCVSAIRSARDVAPTPRRSRCSPRRIGPSTRAILVDRMPLVAPTVTTTSWHAS